MRYDDPLRRLTSGLVFTFAWAAMAATMARGTVPPTFAVQQQDRAVQAYCAQWRESRGRQPLDAEEMNKRVVTDLERRYPAVFPECRRDHQGRCLSWINAMVEGLRRYGHRSLDDVCSNLPNEGAAPQP
jgi:hypothetical protein